MDNPRRDPDAALTRLTVLVREPYDEVICIATLARATLLMSKHRGEARTAMTDGLMQCRVHSRPERAQRSCSRSGTASGAPSGW